MTSHLRCQDVTVKFGGLTACNKVSLDVERGKIVGLIGPNGAGKTTLFNVLSRFQDADEGELYYEDRPIKRLKARESSVSFFSSSSATTSSSARCCSRISLASA